MYLPTYEELSVIEKIYLKQCAINVNGKNSHFKKPNELNTLNVLQINYLLS